MVFYVLDRNEDLVATLSNDNIDNPMIFSAQVTEELNKLYYLNMEVSAIPPETQYLVEENYVLFKNVLGEWQLYIIKNVTEEHGVEHTKVIYAEYCSQELIDENCTYELKDKTDSPSVALGHMLNGTRWEVGTVYDGVTHAGLNSTKNKPTLQAIQTLRAEYGINIKCRIEVVGNKILHRYVDLVQTIGRDLGKRFEYSKDVISVKREIDTGDIKTAIIPVGGTPEGATAPVDITNVVWATPTNPLNKPAGQNYLENPTATAQWGYKGTSGFRPRFIYYENTEIKDASLLIKDAYEKLQQLIIPSVTYTVDAVDLYVLTGDSSLSYESVLLGDTVGIFDKEFKPALMVSAVIIKKKVDLLEPKNTTVELGTYKQTITSDNSDKIRTLNEQMSALAGTTLADLATISQSVQALSDSINGSDVEVPINFNYVRNSDFNNDEKNWDFVNGLSGDAHLGAVTGIPYFRSGAVVSGNSSVSQDIASFQDMVSHYITLSAFVKCIGAGTGWLKVYVNYLDVTLTPKTVTFTSNKIPTGVSGWVRYEFAANFSLPEEGSTITGLTVEFLRDGDAGTTYVTGFMVNTGSKSVPYTVNPSDKYGNGHYAQVKAVNNQVFQESAGYVYTEETDGIWVYDKPTTGNPSKAIALKGGMLGICDWDAQNQKWNVNTFIDGSSVSADFINTGNLVVSGDGSGSNVAIIVEHNGQEVAKIDQKGILVQHNDIATKTVLGADGIKIYSKYDLSNEDVLGSLVGDSSAFATLDVDTVRANNIYTFQTESRNFYINGTSGSDTNDGSSAQPFKTVTHALSLLNHIFIGNPIFNIYVYGTLYENITFEGFQGNGIFNINIDKNAVINGNIKVLNCNCRINLSGGRSGYNVNDGCFVYPAQNVAFEVRNSRYVSIVGFRISCNNNYAFLFANASVGFVYNNDICGCGGTSAVLIALDCSHIEVYDNRGSNNVNGYASQHGSIIAGGTNGVGMAIPSGAIHESSGGKVNLYGSYSVYESLWGYTPPPPPPVTTRTTQWGTTQTKSWRDTYGWRNDNNYVYQGSWGSGLHRGFMCFDSANIRSVLSGATINSVRLYLQRNGSAGNSASTNTYLWGHGYDSLGGGYDLSTNFGYIGGWAWGEAKWVTMSNSVGQQLQSGAIRGLALYIASTSTSYYEYFTGSPQLSITYTK